MPRGRPKKVISESGEETEVIEEVEEETGPNEKENLLALYQTLKDLGIRSISDLENKIANCTN